MGTVNPIGPTICGAGSSSGVVAASLAAGPARAADPAAGQKEEYRVVQLEAFRDGSRQSAIMAPMAKGLTDTDIANISAYLSTLKP